MDAARARSNVGIGAAEVSRAVSEQLRLFVAFQNLTGERYEISSTPVFTVGPPVLFRAGARLSLR